jgi:hypothetical protein
MQKRDKKEYDNNLTYKAETYPLNIVNNTQDFEDTLNRNALEGWRLKHAFTTIGLKLVTIWDK